MKIEAIDLFCGAGGLTYGLERVGIDVKVGIDVDPACAYPYNRNNKARFLEKDVSEVSGSDLKKYFTSGSIKLLAGCAPCQPFSSLRHGEDTSNNKKWSLLVHFARLVRELKPELVTMENVPGVSKFLPYNQFVHSLHKLGYRFESAVVNCADYGLAQERKRFVLMASRLGEINIPKGSRTNRKTVRQVIGKLPVIQAGQTSQMDHMHKARNLSPLNLERIMHSQPGGNWLDWPEHLRLDCHKKTTGQTFKSVYGRMRWDSSSPTVTTQASNIGTGRFVHPDQHRAITLREAAMLQSFPKTYRFAATEAECSFSTVGRLIGNAVPPALGKAIGRTFTKHVQLNEGEI